MRRILTRYPDGVVIFKRTGIAFESPHDIQREVGNRIKAIRQAKGVTQDQLAELTGLNRAHLYRLENGKQSMTLRTLKIIADTLGVRVRDLVGNL
jgi:DNA-binding XRE family transcriptional regulator